MNKAQGDEFFVNITGDGDFLIKVEDLRKLGLSGIIGTTTDISGELHISLRSMQGVTYTFDEKTLTLEIFAQPNLFPKKTIDFLPPRESNIYYPRDSSVFLNCSLDYFSGPSSELRTVRNINELGIRKNDYVFLSSNSYVDSSSDRRFTRLMTRLIHDDRRNLQRFTAGDLITPSINQGSKINIGGIGFSKLYQMDPYFIENPLLDISGHTSLPAEMEVYLDGARIKKESLSPGQFELNNLGLYGGARDVEVVLRDAFGREQRLKYLYYFDNTLLRKGLHEYSYNAGFQREQYGLESNEYGDLIFSGFHRYGRTDALTLGARAEGKNDLYNIAPEVSFRIGNAGIATIAVEGSLNEGLAGMAASLNYRYQNRKISSALSVSGYTEDYATLALRASDLHSDYEARANVSYLLGDMSTLSLSASTSDRFRSQAAINFTTRISRSTTLFLSARNVSGDDSGAEFMVGINYYPWKDHTVSSRVKQGEKSNSQSLMIQKTTPVGEGYGYWASIERKTSDGTTSNRFNPSLQYNSPVGILRGEYIYEDIDGQDSNIYHLAGSGALVYIGKTVGFTRPVKDSFGLVKVGDLEGVGVYSNYQRIGSTGRDGKIIVPDMYSFYDNEIKIDDNDIPMEYSMPVARQVVSPPYRSGTCMFFGLTRFQSYTGTILLAQGNDRIPVEFSEIEMNVKGEKIAILTGRDGVFYFENIMEQKGDGISGYRDMGCKFLEVTEPRPRRIEPGKYKASFSFSGKMCSFEMDIPDSAELEVDLGQIVCIPEPLPEEQPVKPVQPH